MYPCVPIFMSFMIKGIRSSMGDPVSRKCVCMVFRNCYSVSWIPRLPKNISLFSENGSWFPEKISSSVFFERRSHFWKTRKHFRKLGDIFGNIFWKPGNIFGRLGIILGKPGHIFWDTESPIELQIPFNINWDTGGDPFLEFLVISGLKLHILLQYARELISIIKKKSLIYTVPCNDCNLQKGGKNANTKIAERAWEG